MIDNKWVITRFTTAQNPFKHLPKGIRYIYWFLVLKLTIDVT